MAFRIIRRLADLFDVDTSGAADGDALTYDAGSSTWIPGAAGTADTDDQTAAEVPFTPAGTIAATNVQSALVELDSEKAALAHAHDGGDITSGTVADARIASTIARDSEVTAAVAAEATARDAAIAAHTGDATAAHAASAISFTPAGSIAATDVQAAIEEAVSEVVTGAPTGADYLVGTANGGLSAEIVVGTSPGGELGGTWASPTVDATHSGSSHAAVQAAAEATAAAALSAHEADTTAVHGITDTSALVTTSRTITAGAGLTGGGTLAADRTLDVQVDGSTLEIASDTVRVKDGGITSAKIADGTITTGDLAFDPATQTELDAHISDASAAHAASAVSVSSATLSGTGTDVQASLEEIDNLLDDHSARHAAGGADEVTVTVAQIDSEASDFGQVPRSDGTGGVTWEDQSSGGSAAGTTFSPTGSISATDVQTAIAELDTEKQPLDSDLTDIAALSPSNDDVIQRKAGAWTNRTLAQLIADLAALGTTFQPLDSDLTAIAALTTTSFGRSVLDRANAAALATLAGVGTGDSPQFTAVNVGHASDTTLARSGAGDLTVEGNAIYRAGGTDVPLADGGTGASLADPNADRIMFWDDSAGVVTWLAPGTGLTITATTIDAASGSVNDESAILNAHLLAI